MPVLKMPQTLSFGLLSHFIEAMCKNYTCFQWSYIYNLLFISLFVFTAFKFYKVEIVKLMLYIYRSLWSCCLLSDLSNKGIHRNDLFDGQRNKRTRKFIPFCWQHELSVMFYKINKFHPFHPFFCTQLDAIIGKLC